MKHRTNISRRAARGFTLVELLAAVSIAGVLSSIAWPSFEGSLQRARRAEDRASPGARHTPPQNHVDTPSMKRT